MIIPFGPEENFWKPLMVDLGRLPQKTELILVFSHRDHSVNTPQIKYSGKARDISSQLLPRIFTRSKPDIRLIMGLGEHRIVMVQSGTGRAVQMNAGAKFASGEYYWFLHADSHFTEDAPLSLNFSLANHPDALHFFRIRFMDDGGSSMIRFNQWGARFRSEVLGIPFGDQGFCISGENFIRIGGFPEDVPFGEDHIFLWRARQLGIKPVCTGTELHTSARKYKIHGWGRLTLKYQYLWLKQAFPEFRKLLARTVHL